MTRPLRATTRWKPGDRLIHRFNPGLGPGLVQAVEGRTLVVVFPQEGSTLRLAVNNDALRPLELPPGCRAQMVTTGETVLVDETLDGGRLRLADGREVDEQALWPLDVGDSLTERLAQGDVDSLESFALRLDALHLAAIREADGLGSFLGGRIRLYPHQLWVAERATRTGPVRWLLADEVGLGKTVEACLILNHLVRTGRAERVLVVAPETLTVQWLGELWRKYHQVFTLLDDKRLLDVEREHGREFNPFDALHHTVVGLDYLRERPWLAERAAEAGIDLLIVDEAHHLRRPPGHPGNPAYRAVAPIAALGRHVLLLTATPLEEDAHGFFRLLQLLRPEEFPEDQSFEERLRRRETLPPCTSATRRVDIGGLPPRQPSPVDLRQAPGWRALAALERELREVEAGDAAARKRKASRIRRALASGPALDAVLRQGETRLAGLAGRAAAEDPRLAWLVERAPGWKRGGDKTLVFVAHRESLELLRTEMSRRAQTRVGVFHEDLSPGQRDIEVAQFRLESGPSMLISTECGGEGRNFEFCTRLVLFDLPWNPMLVEQRIGRLDRIGRRIPTEIVYFRPPSGVGAAVVDLYETLGLFREPLGSLERELAGVEPVIEELALSGPDEPDHSLFRSVVDRARRAADRVQEAAFHELHRDPYRPELASQILSRIPPDLEELTRDVVIAAGERLHLGAEEHRGGRRWSFELTSRSRVGSLPGVPPASSFLGTFDREEALADEGIDFFASGHPLVEGVLAYLEETSLGRTTLLHVAAEGESSFGLLALYKEGPHFEAVAVDAEGRDRPDWAALLTRRPLRSRRVRRETWTRQAGWPTLVRRMAAHLQHRGRPVAAAVFLIGG